MAEYIEREALREILGGWRDAHADVDDVHGCGLLEDVICEVDAQTAADVAPVVRCKECEHAERYERTDGTVGYYCGHPQNTFTVGERWDRAFKPAKEADDFCSYGERKDGES